MTNATRTGDALNLATLFDPALLARMLDERLVGRRQHPTMPLTIYNYTDRCMYEPDAWNEVTMQCRGLIVDEWGVVLARPFRKFFNYGQRGAPELDMNAPACVTDKLDGSLGVLYPCGSGFAVATRGAFASDQALHATEVWQARYADAFRPPEGFTVLFEIVYRANRIVLDYGTMDDLVLLGAVGIARGRSVGPAHEILASWPGPRAQVMEYATLADALAAPPRKNAEGLVIHFPDADERLKLKQEDYVALHRIVTGLSERTVWEHLKDGKPLADLIAPLPDEFHDWTREVAARLTAHVEAEAATVERAFAEIVAALPEGYTRKDFAMIAGKHEHRWALFARLDGKDYRPGIWEHAKPEAFLSPRIYSEDTA